MFYLNIYDTTMLIRAAITFYSGHKTFEINNKAGTGVARVEAARIWGEGEGGGGLLESFMDFIQFVFNNIHLVFNHLANIFSILFFAHCLQNYRMAFRWSWVSCKKYLILPIQ